MPISAVVKGTPVPLPDTTNRALLLVAREAIRNSVTHAAASEIRLSLRFDTEALREEVRDDGRGFQRPPSSLADGHFGILGMRERMEQIGGSLEVSSGAGQGTTVTAMLPLGAERESA
jgi:signal transduction histidine kinase